MNRLFVTLCVASIAATVAACASTPADEAPETVAEAEAPLVFAPGDPDITWSGPSTYSALWAKQAFTTHPGLYIYQSPQGQTAGAVYLSGPVACLFSSYGENAQRLFISSNQCSGDIVGLKVSLDCLKQTGFLSCAGTLTTASGLQSSLSMVIDREKVCAPGNCLIGPFDPMPSGPDGPADCRRGEMPCGGGCCLRGERCGDGNCYVREEGDVVAGGRD